VPGLTADNAVDGAFRQGDPGDRYEITVINTGGAPANGSSATPVTATVTVSAGQTVEALYGSGWTCNLAAITEPQAEPADTCYRGDVLPGENGEEPPITVVVSVAGDAPATGTETVQVDGGGNVGGPASVAATTAIAPAPTPPAAAPTSGTPPQLTVTSSHAGSLAQGDPPTLPPTSSSRHNPVTNTFEPQPVCTRSGALAAGASYPPITLDVAVADNVELSVANTATVEGGGTPGGQPAAR
jgi:hypothetical protein